LKDDIAERDEHDASDPKALLWTADVGVLHEHDESSILLAGVVVREGPSLRQAGARIAA
jgi:hypothetical protein